LPQLLKTGNVSQWLVMRPLVFIDGHAGATGLRIREWLTDRDDIELLAIEESPPTDLDARRRCFDRADLVILCLPTDAARQAVGRVESSDARILDSSAAHRVAEGWVYGLPELSPERRGAIAASKRVSTPGCDATAVALLLRPLVDAGMLPRDAPVTIHALSGYSGGDGSATDSWESSEAGLRSLPFETRYALDGPHEQMPEILRYAALQHEPQLLRSMGAFRCGTRVEIPLHAAVLPMGVTGQAVWEILDHRYSDEPFTNLLPLQQPLDPDELALDPRRCNDTNRIELRVVPHADGHVLLVAVLDSLGKGAAGATVQNLNLMLGFPEDRGIPA
jgi:N-acetyl-gamma-glutamyl-phosphate reductase